ncbi:hypothetical protein HanIR_Chr10g0489511 [Helianthus annuus]|nr:hypothetical protein HanIR_Chr10g0489511 [Helianthus annuus]
MDFCGTGYWWFYGILREKSRIFGYFGVVMIDETEVVVDFGVVMKQVWRRKDDGGSGGLKTWVADDGLRRWWF